MGQFFRGAWAGFKRLLTGWFVGFLFGLTGCAALCALRYWPLWTMGVIALFLPLHWNDLKRGWAKNDRGMVFARAALLLVCGSVVVGVVGLASDFIPDFDAFDHWAFGILLGFCVLTGPYWYWRRAWPLLDDAFPPVKEQH